MDNNATAKNTNIEITWVNTNIINAPANNPSPAVQGLLPCFALVLNELKKPNTPKKKANTKPIIEVGILVALPRS